MLEQTGDLFSDELSCDARCVTTNGVLDRSDCLVMGAGVALAAKRKFPSLPRIWGDEVRKHGGPILSVTVFPGIPYAVVSFPTKYHWRDPSSTELIAKSARLLVKATDAHGWKRILLPRPGCLNGGLAWPDVREILSPILDDRFTVINLEV